MRNSGIGPHPRFADPSTLGGRGPVPAPPLVSSAEPPFRAKKYSSSGPVMIDGG